jgi:hypothetical protein
MADERWSIPSYMAEGNQPNKPRIRDEISNLPDFGDRPIGEADLVGGDIPAPSSGTTQVSTVAETPVKEVEPRENYNEMPWSEVGSRAFSNAPGSAWKAIKGVGEAIYNYDDTASALGQLGKGVISKAKGALGFEIDPEAEAMVDAIGNMYSDRYGSKAGFKETLAEDPFAIGMDVASIVPVVGPATKAAGIGSMASGLSKVAALGDPINLALQTAKLGTKAVTKPAALASRIGQGVASNVPQNALKLANEAGRSADPMARSAFSSFASKRGESRDIARTAMVAMEERRKAASDFYTSRKSELTTQELPMSDIKNALNDAMTSLNRYGTRNSSEQIMALQKMEAMVQKYETHPNPAARTAVELDLLKRDLRDVADQLKPSDRGAVSAVPRAVRDTIAKVDPTYAEMMDYWSDWIGQMRDLQSTLGTSDRTSETARLAKLMSTMKSGSKMSLLRELAETPSGKYLPYMIAGASVSEVLPPYLQALGLGAVGTVMTGGPHGLAVAAAGSPKLAGIAQYNLGSTERVANAIPSPPAAASNVLSQIGAEREGRKSGGRVGVSHDKMADQLVMAAERAKKGISKGTESLLEMPDDHVAHALEVANRSI